ncbi:MAG: glycosyltransferase family 2 protein [Candidatus Caenarcaniphilales bacterium]|nr:glycosyltransferase family 2 protein [Candidatus Caenarcaniphilales bacterium]
MQSLNQNSQIELSIIIPFKNEEESLPILSEEILDAMSDFNKPWECLWINDGSDDSSQRVMKHLIEKNPNYRLINLAKNFGQSAALAIGFKYAQGKYLSMLDADLQNDPKDLPKLYSSIISEGVDLVNGVRIKRQDDLVRKISSKLANSFRNALTGSSVTDVGCSIRVFRRECVQSIPVFKGMHRFLPTLIQLQGYTITETPVNHRPRQLGVAKYGINNRLWVGIIDTLVMIWMQNRLVFPKVKEIIQKEISYKRPPYKEPYREKVH